MAIDSDSEIIIEIQGRAQSEIYIIVYILREGEKKLKGTFSCNYRKGRPFNPNLLSHYDKSELPFWVRVHNLIGVEIDKLFESESKNQEESANKHKIWYEDYIQERNAANISRSRYEKLSDHQKKYVDEWQMKKSVELIAEDERRKEYFLIFNPLWAATKEILDEIDNNLANDGFMRNN